MFVVLRPPCDRQRLRRERREKTRKRKKLFEVERKTEVLAGSRI